jgi:uncharacterized membrane protein YheB (UPF0754 family)
MQLGILKYLLAPFICAFIGWLTNYIAVKMLFHPKEPKKFLGLTIHGVFPKRQKALAQNLGWMVEKELVSHEDITRVIQDPALLEKFQSTIEVYVDTFLQEKLSSLSPMVSMFLQGSMLEKVKGMLIKELNDFLPDIIQRATEEIEERLDFSEIVREKVESFSMDKLELILHSIMKSEFRFIEMIGGILGFLIGTFQSLFYYLV